MASTRKDQNGAGAGVRSARREHMVALAGEFFAEKGYRATTVREIADADGAAAGR